MITSTRLYVPVVTLSINDNIKILDINQGIRRTISWNKYRCEITTQTESNNLDYLIDPTFRNINRLCALSMKNGNNDPTRDSFNKYYMLLVEIKKINELIDNKPFFDQPIKNKQEVYEKILEMSRNDNYITRNLLDYLYHQIYYKLIGKYLLKQTNKSIPQQISFTGKLEKEDRGVMFFIAESKKIF